MLITTSNSAASDITASICKNLANKLTGRVEAAYIFGSRAAGNEELNSDLDLILIQNTSKKFFERVDDFGDLFCFDIPIDLFIYTPTEFQKLLLERGDYGFWKSVKNSMLRIA